MLSGFVTTPQPIQGLVGAEGDGLQFSVLLDLGLAVFLHVPSPFVWHQCKLFRQRAFLKQMFHKPDISCNIIVKPKIYKLDYNPHEANDFTWY